MQIELPTRQPCPFCENLAGRHPCAIIFRNEVIASFVNPRQYGRGSVLVIPTRHAPTMLDLTSDEVQAIYLHAQALTQALHATFYASGYNLFQNNGVAAGQSVAHFHLHIVPRYGNDDPSTIFSHENAVKTPIEERQALADAIRIYLVA